MKEIKLTHYHKVTASKKGANYIVDLGGKNRYEFTQEKECKTFLNSTSKELNAHLRTINDLYVQVVSVVQSYYFDYSNNAVVEYNYMINSTNEAFQTLFTIQNRDNNFYYKRAIIVANTVCELILFAFRNANKINYTNIEYRLESIQTQIDKIIFSIRKKGNYLKSKSDSIIIWNADNLPIPIKQTA